MACKIHAKIIWIFLNHLHAKIAPRNDRDMESGIEGNNQSARDIYIYPYKNMF